MTATAKPTMINPDGLFVRNHRKKIRDNNGYCPSQPDKTPGNKCPCTDFKHGGDCTCGMYIDAAVCDNQVQ